MAQEPPALGSKEGWLETPFGNDHGAVTSTGGGGVDPRRGAAAYEMRGALWPLNARSCTVDPHGVRSRAFALHELACDQGAYPKHRCAKCVTAAPMAQ
jgi:hypothetical protein